MITAQEVIDYLEINLSETDSHLALIVPAVNEMVEALPSIDRTALGAWKATTHLGAIMLAARLYQRKNSPSGITSIGEGVSTYISRYDSDIARLLNIDSFQKPMVY